MDRTIPKEEQQKKHRKRIMLTVGMTTVSYTHLTLPTKA